MCATEFLAVEFGKSTQQTVQGYAGFTRVNWGAKIPFVNADVSTLDYLLVSTNMSASSATVFNNVRQWNSDHFPVMSELKGSEPPNKCYMARKSNAGWKFFDQQAEEYFVCCHARMSMECTNPVCKKKDGFNNCKGVYFCPLHFNTHWETFLD